MRKVSFLAVACLMLFAGLATADPSGNNIVLNEIYPNPSGNYDGAEFIELYNPTGSAIDIGGWVLAGTEYDETCGGEDRWQFPAGTSVPAGGYVVVAKDGADGDDGFYEEFGFYPDFEFFDPSFAYDDDSPLVDNMTLLDDDPATYYSDEITLVGGNGYGVMCGGYSNADVVYLYTSATLLTLVDLVEYMNPEECTTDPCTGDDGADDNAFQGIPFLGNTLGRDSSGADTDASIDDWTYQAPTPGAMNFPNTPPWIRNVRYSPIPPTGGTPTDITSIVTDDGTIDSVMVYYNVDGAGWGRVFATTPDSVYTGSIPAQLNGSQVEYYVRAVDNYGAGINYPAEGKNDPYTFSVGYTSIYNVQFVSAGGDSSSLVGQAVNIRGIVTAGNDVFASNSFFIHEGTGPFKGVKCYAPGLTSGDIVEGDDVTFCGTVSEYYNETEIYLHFSDALVVHSNGNPTYGFTEITTAQANSLSVEAERYEGQLCQFDDVTVTYEPNSYGEWRVRDSSGEDAWVGDYGYYYYQPEVLDNLSELRGIMTYNFSQYKLEPRSDDDVVGPPTVGTVRYTPIPPEDGETVTVTCVAADDIAVTSATLYYALSAGGPFTGVPMSEVTRYEGTWTGDMGPFSDGDRVYYYVEVSDGQMDGRVPTAGSYSLYVGLLDIADIQTVAAGQDTSTLNGLAANIQGVVTVAPGEFSDYNWYVQDDSGAWNGILVYDRTGSLAFERGDEVVLCGEVGEYYGETELALHFAEAAEVVASRATIPAPVSIATGLLQNVVSAEQYEGVLVYAEDCTVEDADLGFGEWAITNGAAADTCRVDDLGDYDYVPTFGDNVYVIGVVQYAYGLYRIQPRDNADIAANPVGIDDGITATKFGLSQNAPNPFNPVTEIAFSVPRETDVELAIYDVIGRRVATLVDGTLEGGVHRAVWNGRSDTGEQVASGVYFYRLMAGDEMVSRKMVLLK
jgi:hypothetical protein